MTDPGWTQPEGEDPAGGALGIEVIRLADALRRLSLPRWQRPPRRGEGQTVAEQSRGFVVRLAALQQAAGDRPRTGATAVPSQVGAHGLADQLQVIGRDAASALADHPTDALLTAEAMALVAELHALRMAL